MKGKLIKWGLISLVTGILITSGVVYYLFNMPHRDVQAATADYEMTANDLIKEYLVNPQAANEKYLDENGESGILAITGTVASMEVDLNDQIVVLLQSDKSPAGVSCTFTTLTNDNAANLKAGDVVAIKGVIRSGASYDNDLELYENVIMEKCDVIRVNNQE